MDSPLAAQLGFEGMPVRLFPATPTRLNTWLDCPRRYRMAYLDRPTPSKGPPWAHNSVGASAHNALRDWWGLPVERRNPDMAGELLHTGWLTDGFRDDRQLEHWRSRTRTQVERYAEGLDPTDEPLGVERTVASRTGRLAISGRVDRIDERMASDDASDSDATEAIIVDYKTGRRQLTETDARSSMALALYALSAGATLRRPCHTVELHHLPSDTVASWRHDDASLDRHLRRAESIAGEAQAAEQALTTAGPVATDTTSEPIDTALSETLFPAQPGPLCSWCDFRMHCPEGQQAAPTKPPWAALEEPSLDES